MGVVLQRFDCAIQQNSTTNNSAAKSSTIKNSITKSNDNYMSIIQALQRQAQQLLPIISQALIAQGFSEIEHQRISQQHNQETPDSHTDDMCYQGLTRAQHLQLGWVMIKWQLSSEACHISGDLIREANILAALNTVSREKNTLTNIAPPLLDCHCLAVQFLAQPHKLIIAVMPYYPNGSLAGRLNVRKHPPMTAQQKHNCILQSAHLIADLHHTGLLHNDIKPSNILLDDAVHSGVPHHRSVPSDVNNNEVIPGLLLTDFALAEYSSIASVANTAGSPAYLAPECWQGQGSTVQSDIYAFAIMLYEILVGERPFSINTQSSEPMTDWAIQHCQQPIPKLLSKYGMYQCIIHKALAKRKEKRYQSMMDVIIDLENL